MSARHTSQGKPALHCLTGSRHFKQAREERSRNCSSPEEESEGQQRLQVEGKGLAATSSKSQIHMGTKGREDSLDFFTPFSLTSRTHPGHVTGYTWPTKANLPLTERTAKGKKWFSQQTNRDRQNASSRRYYNDAASLGAWK